MAIKKKTVKKFIMRSMKKVHRHKNENTSSYAIVDGSRNIISKRCGHDV